MPQLGETVTEGTITRWAKKVGDHVEMDEVLFEVSTDKVDSEVPSSAAGFLTEILVPEGDTVDVGTKLAVISDQAPSGDGAAAAVPAPAPTPPPPPAPEVQASPPPPPPAPPAAPARPPVSAPTAAPEGEGVVLSPVVRRLLAEHRLDPSQITGTGAGGRITRDDVLAYIDVTRTGSAPAATPAPAAASPTPAPAPVAPAAPPVVAARPGEREQVIPFSKIRKITAEHMVRSKQTSAHTAVIAEVDYAGVDRVRKAQRSSFKEAEGFSLTYLPFIARAVVDALADYPHLNASVGNDELIVHQYLNLGIAVDLNFEGLLVPVIRDADGKRLRAIAREIADLAARARNKRLTVDDLQGGTFTLTNAGPFGTFLTLPVINQPQIAIVSTDGVKKRPVAVELPDGSDAVVVHPVGLLALQFDHRAVDGAYAAAFIARVKEIIETRDWAEEL